MGFVINPATINNNECDSGESRSRSESSIALSGLLQLDAGSSPA